MVPAANNYLNTKHVESADRYFQTADLILLQLEISMNVVEFTVSKAKNTAKVGLYASPAQRLSEELVENLDFIIVKSNELHILFGEEQREEILKNISIKFL